MQQAARMPWQKKTGVVLALMKWEKREKKKEGYGDTKQRSTVNTK